ncbi:MAG: PocR ligand-binding domain-containing protein [Clostridiales bacterium]|mgnify:CR=1 FL=1|nr:PocR ligand-binding domain-containing protein [Clostridiales bacterium]MDO4350052.1 PocR ligand-binding domain-containing protein [Eubacteriales bacterium]MDY4009205.1 PocR ligand-binding domain-containing protein [Candidatus Limiplasma sp.]
MLTGEEFEKLAALLKHLHICLGLKFALMDDQAKEVFTSSKQAEFCMAVKCAPGGLERCLSCDRMALKEMNATQKMKKYRCHCGLIEVAMPVVENGKILASILFGQFLDETPREKQWERSRELLSWYAQEAELKESYGRLQQVSSVQLSSLVEIIHACISEVRLQGMLSIAQMSDAHRLKFYILQHYAKPISLNVLCAEMHMGKSKLFALCQKEFHMTPGQLILQTRIDAAKKLLEETSASLAEIAQAVGFPDVSYFCQRFKLVCGETPKEYRRSIAMPSTSQERLAGFSPLYGAPLP